MLSTAALLHEIDQDLLLSMCRIKVLHNSERPWEFADYYHLQLNHAQVIERNKCRTWCKKASWFAILHGYKSARVCVLGQGSLLALFKENKPISVVFPTLVYIFLLCDFTRENGFI